jgi:plastocyanin
MRIALVLAPLALSIAACGGGGDGGTNPPPPAPVATVGISQSTASVHVNESVSLTASPKDANGTALSGRAVTWALTPATDVVTISPSGAAVQVTGAKLGTATLTATSEGKTGTATVTVVAGTITYEPTAEVTVLDASFSPTKVDIAAGGTVTWTWGTTVTHNVTFGGGPATVATITDRSSGNASRTFPTAGTYDYHCTIHAGMNATVVAH